MSHQRMASPAVVAALLAGLTVAGAARAADLKPIGVIDSQRIVQEYGAAKDAQEQYQKFVQDLQQRISDKEKEIQVKMEELDSQRMLLGEDALRAKTEELDKLKTDYFDMRQKSDSQAEQEFKKRIQPIIDQVKLIAERIGKEEGYGLIVDSSSMTTVYIDKSIDLTDKILEALVKGKGQEEPKK